MTGNENNMRTAFWEAASCLPREAQRALMQDEQLCSRAVEIRLRLGQPLAVEWPSGRAALPQVRVTQRLLDDVFPVSYTHLAITNGIRVYGIKRGYNGLYHGDMFEMNLRSVSDIINRGGTILYTARSKEFNSPEGVLKAKEQCEKAGLDAIVCIGGDGTFRGALDLSRVGVPCVGIPGTIDNDIGCSEYTIGYDTAMNLSLIHI